jgi:hypothetical protein
MGTIDQNTHDALEAPEGVEADDATQGRGPTEDTGFREAAAEQDGLEVEDDADDATEGASPVPEQTHA